MKNVLLTGVGGFLGVHFLKYYFANTDWHIIGLDSFKHKGTYSRLNEIEIPQDRFTLLKHDLSVPIDHQLENRIMNRRINERGIVVDRKIDAIINLASDSAVERSVQDPGWCWRNNCELIYNMLELARKVKPKVFFQCSTDEVYGDCSLESEGHHEWDIISPSNPYCLLPDTRIFTNNGWIEIKDLDILKDKITSKSSASSISFQKAHKKFKYNYCGNVRSIKTVVGQISATDEHKFFRMETHFSSGNGLKNIHGEPISLRPHRKIVEQPAKNLKKGDKVLCARYMPFPKETIKHDVDFARFLGYFIGDGSFSVKNKCVRLADQKLEYIEYYQSILKNLLGVSKKSSTGNFGNIYKHSSKDCWYLQFASENLRDMVDLSSKTKIVESSLNFDKNSVLSFIGGFFDAESHFRIVEKNILKSIACFQKSKRTLEVVQLLLHRVGVVSSIRETKKGYVLIISDSYSLKQICDNVPTKKKEIDFLLPKMQHKNWNKKFYWCRILEIQDKHYEGLVYDLEVLKHRNFIAEFFVVHNSASKAAQESLSISYWRSFGVPVVLTNCMNCIATMQDKEKFLPKIIWKIATDQPMDIYVDYDKDGNRLIGSRRYLHCENHADVFKFLIDKPFATYAKGDKFPDRYNVVGEVELNNLEMAEAVAKIMGKTLKPNFVSSESARPGYDRRYALKPGKLESVGWKRPVEFYDGLEKIVKWTLEHPWWVV
jgi:dTDP-D-glucose 4,6-dehydratase/intein/homing endonuclease